MNAFSTETIPTKSPFYQETAEAYSCSPRKIPIWEEAHIYRTPRQFSYSLTDEDFLPPQTSDNLSDLLLCQYKKTEHTKNSAQFLSFILRCAIQKTQHNVLTASFEALSLKNLRRYISNLESSLTGQVQDEDVSTRGIANEAISNLCFRIELINDYCDSDDQLVVLQYFSDYPQLIEVVKNGLIKAKEVFGPNTNFRFKIVKDKESIAPPKLFVYIILSDLGSDPCDIFRRFDSEWYLNQSDEILDLLAFNIWQ